MPVGPSPTATSHKYSVPIVLTDVAPAEGLLSAFDALAHLASVTTDVFSRISTRITDQKSQLSSLLSRIQAAQQRVDQISKNSGRVTTIYSTSKYPAPKVLPHLQRLVASDGLMLNDQPLDNAQRKALPHKLKAALRDITAPPTDSSDLFKFFTQHRVTHGEHDGSVSAEEKESSGLGRLPSYLPSVSSILLFNTDENPYKTYNSLNNLEGVGGEDRKQQLAGPSEAPKSIVDGSDLPAFAGFQFDYKPLLGEMPTLQLPANLPLTRLADISFGTEQPAASIAPSIAPALPSLDMLALPSVTTTHRKEAKSTVPQYLALGPGTASSSSSSSSSSASSSSSVPAPPSAPDAPPAPPGPPMAPPAPPSAPPTSAPPVSTSDEGEDDSQSGGDGDGDNARSALLSAIRDQKNMSRLKKVGDRLKEQEKAREKRLLTSAAGGDSAGGGGGGGGGEDSSGGDAGADDSGGDLMAALRARLARRRHVIGGKNQDEKVAPTSQAQAAPPPEWARRSTLRPPPRKGGAEDDKPEMDVQQKANMSDVVQNAVAAHKAAKQKEDEDWEQLE